MYSYGWDFVRCINLLWLQGLASYLDSSPYRDGMDTLTPCEQLRLVLTRIYICSRSSLVGTDCLVCRELERVSLYETLPLSYNQWRLSPPLLYREWWQWAVGWSSCCCAGGHQISVWTVVRQSAQYPSPVCLAAAQVSESLVLALYPGCFQWPGNEANFVPAWCWTRMVCRCTVFQLASIECILSVKGQSAS